MKGWVILGARGLRAHDSCACECVCVYVRVCVWNTRVSQVKSNVYKVEQALDQNCGRVR